MRRFQTGVLMMAVIGLAAPAVMAQSAPIIYVSDFKAVYQSPGSDGHFHRLRTAIRQSRAEDAAAALARDMVAAFNAKGVRASYLGATDPRPASGWLVGGTFHEGDTKGLLASLASGGAKTPNTDVSVSVSDLASPASQPFATIGTRYALKGQGSDFSIDPYEVAAKFVIHKIESGPSINALSQQIVDKILAGRHALHPLQETEKQEF